MDHTVGCVLFVDVNGICCSTDCQTMTTMFLLCSLVAFSIDAFNVG